MSNDHSPLPENEREHYRALLQQEQRRVADLSLINEVQRCILSSTDSESFLPLVAQALAHHFTGCDVAVFLSLPLPITCGEDNESSDSSSLRLAAWAGHHGLISRDRNEISVSTDFAMRSLDERRTLICGFCGQSSPDDAEFASIAIPLIQQRNNFGVLELRSKEEDTLDADDIAVLQMISSFLAARIESCVAYAELRELSSFQHRLFSTMLHSLLVLDTKGRICSANARFCETVGSKEVELKGVALSDVFDGHELAQSGFNEALMDVSENGVPHELEGVPLSISKSHVPNGSLIFDIRLFRVFYHHEPCVVVLFINLSSRWRSFHQLQLMSEIGRYFSASLDINKVLRTVLTCITAGNGLGFNRAFLLLLDEKENQLKGTLALGASSALEAQRIWRELAENQWDLQQMLEAAENVSDDPASSQLQNDLSELVVDINNPLFPALQKALAEHRTIRVLRRELLAETLPPEVTEIHRSQWERAGALFDAAESVIAPLLAKDRLVGVLLVDNLFSGSSIEESDVQLLDSLAGQAGLTIDNARTYDALQKAQKELVNSERLAVVGDLTARLSHEIRNPLSTIGGFARRLCKHPENVEAVLRNASVIVEETERLEELLNDLLEMARPDQLEMELHHLSDLIDQALLLADADIKALGVRIEKEYDKNITEVFLDRARILQALLNIIRNGAQSMPKGGVLQIKTCIAGSKEKPMVQICIRDQGKGIPPNAVKHVFDPFYSTKLKGSGLGLPITWRIIQDHGGEIEVESQLSMGTTFIISLPMQAERTA